jgi:hypothetical protein
MNRRERLFGVRRLDAAFFLWPAADKKREEKRCQATALQKVARWWIDFLR